MNTTTCPPSAACAEREVVYQHTEPGFTRTEFAPRAPFVLSAAQWKRPMLHIAVLEVEEDVIDATFDDIELHMAKTRCSANIDLVNARWHDEVGDFPVCITCAQRAEQARFEEAAECACGKATYPSKPDAERIIWHLRRHRNKREEKPCRAYRCPERKGWHITSWTKPKGDQRSRSRDS